jgi:hypothetical protein
MARHSNANAFQAITTSETHCRRAALLSKRLAPRKERQMNVKFQLSIAIALVSISAAASVTQPVQPSLASAIDPVNLGISTFAISETPARSSVVAMDAAGTIIGRLDLVHGRFALTGAFKDDYDSAEVDGRQLRVAVRGQELVWETAGYEPVFHLPAHPPSQRMLAAFLDEVPVRRLLDRWRIGFDASPIAAASEPAGYVSGSEPGAFVADCGGLATCGPLVGGRPVNTCGALSIATRAIRISRTGSYTEDLVAQCCPASGVLKPIFAIKVCPPGGPNSDSSCGRTGPTGACKACPGYPADAQNFCDVRYRADTSAVDYCFSDTNASPATIIVQNTPPQLWPPDHSFVTVDVRSCVQSVSDGCYPSLTLDDVVSDPSFAITYVGSDEANSNGRFGDSADIVKLGPHTVSLRRDRSAQRASAGDDGRVYHVGLSYTNSRGVRSALDCQIGVPHDASPDARAVDSWVAAAGSPLNPGFVVFYH